MEKERKAFPINPIVIFGTVALIMLRVYGYLVLPWWLILLPYIIACCIWIFGLMAACIMALIHTKKQHEAKRKEEALKASINTLRAVLKEATKDERDS